MINEPKYLLVILELKEILKKQKEPRTSSPE